MPMYMDIHEIQGATAEAVAKAHSADVETQKKYGVEYHLVSNVVAELSLGKGLAFEDLGEVSLKGFEHPLRVHAIKHTDE